MKKLTLLLTITIIAAVMLFWFSPESLQAQTASSKAALNANQFGGYKSQVQWGEHLVRTGGCGDCHTPKKMTQMGPADDSARLLSGHPAQQPAPDVNRQEAQSKGLTITQTLTAWVGPWGISYSANLTPDGTGIGSWTEKQFIYALREGKFKGLPNSRPILPPMPLEAVRNYTDDELKAIFSYLKSIKPVNNAVPQAQPPAGA